MTASVDADQKTTRDYIPVHILVCVCNARVTHQVYMEAQCQAQSLNRVLTPNVYRKWRKQASVNNLARLIIMYNLPLHP